MQQVLSGNGVPAFVHDVQMEPKIEDLIGWTRCTKGRGPWLILPLWHAPFGWIQNSTSTRGIHSRQWESVALQDQYSVTG
jgi:hypothetical protein